MKKLLKKILNIKTLVTTPLVWALAAASGWLAMIPVARAVDIPVSPTIPNSNPASASPAGWVSNFYNFALLISGVLAFGAVVYGGILYLTSAGNPSRQSEGKEWIESALIGVLLLAGAYLILQIVNPAIVNINNALPSNLPAVNTQPTK